MPRLGEEFTILEFSLINFAEWTFLILPPSLPFPAWTTVAVVLTPRGVAWHYFILYWFSSTFITKFRNQTVIKIYFLLKKYISLIFSAPWAMELKRSINYAKIEQVLYFWYIFYRCSIKLRFTTKSFEIKKKQRFVSVLLFWFLIILFSAFSREIKC